MNIVKKEMKWGEASLTLETGRMARQADGAVLASMGETAVLATVVGERKAREDIDFFPLSVNYIERSYAAGKIPGGFFKREGRPSEKEILTSRLIDRPIRPLFDKNYQCETQVLCHVLAHDLRNDADIVAMIAASAALSISGLPFLGPVGAVRVGYRDGSFILNPAINKMESSQLDLVVAGTKEGVLMVESEARELDEGVMLDAVMFGHDNYQSVINLIDELAKECGKEKREIAPPPAFHKELRARVQSEGEQEIARCYAIHDKKERVSQLNIMREQMMEKCPQNDEEKQKLSAILHDTEKDVVRSAVLSSKKRIDGRALADIRPITCEVGVLPLSHGSALFTRGETQALGVATLGTGQDEQIIDALMGEYRSHFMLHYNFPPFSVNEVGRVGAVGRREVGHGKLAWRALNPLMPKKTDFPYTIRLVSEILESNGSSSMATVCASSLAMMDGGIPLLRPVAGIAMGLIKEGNDFVVLSDILGDEDHLGDMDFKVAGSEKGITSLQMDIKITSITRAIMEQALSQAREGRLHILREMMKALPEARADLSSSAPRVHTIPIAKDKIREVIGVGGKVIRDICEKSGAKVEVDDDGVVRIAASDVAAIEKATQLVTAITAEPEIGAVYEGTVVRCVDFGAFVNFMGGKDGLVHISELSDGRVERTTDIVNEGDKVTVRVLDIDDRGRVRLTMRSTDANEPLPVREPRKRTFNRGERGDRGGISNFDPKRKRNLF